MYKLAFCLVFLAVAIRTSNGNPQGPTLTIKQHPTIKMVNCGNHLAPSCDKCGTNRRVCTGSCKWEAGKCLGLEHYACSQDCFSRRTCRCIGKDEDGNKVCLPIIGRIISTLPH